MCQFAKVPEELRNEIRLETILLEEREQREENVFDAYVWNYGLALKREKNDVDDSTTF